MYHSQHVSEGRSEEKHVINSDVVIVGGGLAGVCAAIEAAREGAKVTLVQDRPVLGGNSSSEVRLWILGATSHMGNNNRFSREGGVINELLLENLYRNKEGNTVIFDTVLLDKVIQEPNITLLLNTCVFQTHKDSDTRIQSVEAFCSQTSTTYRLVAQYFCDASGDGIVAFQAGASFRMGSESQSEFSEKLAPEKANKDLLGHSLYFYSKDVGHPVNYVPPSYASINKLAIDRVRRINPEDMGSRLWWIEYGGNHDTIKDSEKIKFELWKVVYGVWDYIKNSGNYKGVENLTLEWVGSIPGKRESRRFNGQYMLTQQDVIDQNQFDDAISFGGWSIDHHPSAGFETNDSPCTQYHSKGVYQIPMRCFISKEVENLFFAGRIISTSHIAFGSTRVMATCGHGGQAVGHAMAYCSKNNVKPESLYKGPHIGILQNRLNEKGHFIPGLNISKDFNLAATASISASSSLKLRGLPSARNNGKVLWRELTVSAAQLMPLRKGTRYQFQATVKAVQKTSLIVELRSSLKTENYTPDNIIERLTFDLNEGEHNLDIRFSEEFPNDQYGMLCFLKNEYLAVASSENRVTSLVSVFNGTNKAVSNTGKQVAIEDSGIESFEFWTPERRPGGHNIAFEISPPIKDFEVQNIVNGHTRPWLHSNAWVADLYDDKASITLEWEQTQSIREILLHFDGDFDHALESSLMGHPEDRIPFCIENYRVFDMDGDLLFQVKNNIQSFNHLVLSEPISTKKLRFEFEQVEQNIPVSIFEIVIKN